jgi:hypothetical protein
MLNLGCSLLTAAAIGAMTFAAWFAPTAGQCRTNLFDPSLAVTELVQLSKPAGLLAASIKGA